jgi:phosphatidyl-myo-inositol dimannoside synthase
VRFVARALVESRHDWTGTLVVVLHLHLLPVAWPLVARGARLLPVLIGIEAWRPHGRLRQRMLARATRALAISSHTAREFVRANPGLAALPIDVCHPAVPPLAPPGASPVSSHPPFALIVGRMSQEERYKGHDLLIDVWPKVRIGVPAARLVVAGGGDDIGRLRQRVHDAGLDTAIEFTGPVSAEELAALYRDAACFVLPSRNEGFGFVLLEAMSRRARLHRRDRGGRRDHRPWPDRVSSSIPRSRRT